MARVPQDGKPPRPFPDRLVARAKQFVGVTEQPAGTNRGPYNHVLKGGIDDWCKRANGQTGYAWCSAFACAMSEDAGFHVADPRRASVGFLLEWARASGRVVTRPLRGDLVCFRFDHDTWPDHVEIITRVIGVSWRQQRFVGVIRTTGGNTSSGRAGSQSNGGGVWNRTRVCTGRESFIRLVPRKKR